MREGKGPSQGASRSQTVSQRLLYRARDNAPANALHEPTHPLLLYKGGDCASHAYNPIGSIH